MPLIQQLRIIVAVCILTFVDTANAACSISDIDIKSRSLWTRANAHHAFI
jgi:hypothetical protein